MSNTYGSFPSAYRVHVISENEDGPEKSRNGPVSLDELVGFAREYLERGQKCRFVFFGKSREDSPVDINYNGKNEETTVYELSQNLEDALCKELRGVEVDFVFEDNRPTIYVEQQSSK